MLSLVETVVRIISAIVVAVMAVLNYINRDKNRK